MLIHFSTAPPKRCDESDIVMTVLMAASFGSFAVALVGHIFSIILAVGLGPVFGVLGVTIFPQATCAALEKNGSL